jgi:GAF domain-containing protein
MHQGPDADDIPALDETRRLRALARTGLSADADDRMERACRMVARLLDVPVALVSLVDATRQFFPGAHGLLGDLAIERETPLAQSLCKEVVASHRPLRIEDLPRDAHHRGHPAGSALGVGAYLGVPLIDSGGNVLGSLCAISPEARTWSDDDVTMLVDLAIGVSSDLRSRIAMSIANEARVETSAAHERLRTILQAADALASSLEPDVALSRMLDVVVPSMARWAAVYFAPDVDAAARIVVRHADPSLDHALRAFVDTPREDEYDPPAIRAVISGESPFVLTPPALRPGMPADLVRTLEQLGVGPGLVVPVSARTEITGALLVVGETGAPEYSIGEIQVMIDLGARAGMAIENSRLYGRQRDVALTLQRSLLPPLPAIDGMDLAAIYRPASSGVEVGGDWYDAVRLPTNAACLTIGDVTGHSVAATAVMGKLRGVLHSYAADELGPNGMLAKIDRDAAGLLDGLMATCLVACIEFDRDRPHLVWSSAGHLPIVLAEPDGRVEVLDVGTDILVGALPSPARHLHERTLEPGSWLVFYTDGLVERRDQPLDAGLQELVATIASLDLHAPPGDWCEAIVRSMAPDGSDDVAVLVARLEA